MILKQVIFISDILNVLDIDTRISIFVKKEKILVNIPIDLKSIIKKPITLLPDTGILDARDTLLRYNISRLIVVSGKIPVGVITKKDIAKSISVFNKKPITKLTVKDIMSKNLVSVTIDSSIYDCARLMKKHDISSIVVRNTDKTLFGIVTKTDLVSTFLVQSTASLKVSKIMTKNVITVSTQDSLLEVQSVLFNNSISRVIVAHNKEPVGIITYSDFVPAKAFDQNKELPNFYEKEEISQTPWLNEININRFSHMLSFSASDIMTKNPFVAYTDDVVYTVAILMIRNKISGIPVVQNKKLVGIVTKSDIVNVLATKGKIDK